MKTSKDSDTPSQKASSDSGGDIPYLTAGGLRLAGWSTGTFLVPGTGSRCPFVLPAAALFRMLKNRFGSASFAGSEQIDLRGRGVRVFSSAADGFLPLLFLTRRRLTSSWLRFTLAEGRVLDAAPPGRTRCGYAGAVRLSRRMPASADALGRGTGPAGFFGMSREKRLLFLARLADACGEREKNGIVRLSLQNPGKAVRVQMLCQSLGLNARLFVTAEQSVLEIPPSPAWLRFCRKDAMRTMDGTGQDAVRTARLSAAEAHPLPVKDDGYEFAVDGEGFDVNGMEV